MARALRRAVAAAAIFGIVSMVVMAVAVWLIVRDEVSTLRVALRASTPVAPVVRAAILAAEDPFIEQRPRFSLRALLPPPKGTVSCGPSLLAFTLVKATSPRRRALRWHIETAVTTYTVGSVFSSEELLRIYAHEIYLGRVAGREIRGVEQASAIYFAKSARDLTPAEAATLAAMIRAPNVFAPHKDPARVVKRRNYVLGRMRRFGFIGQRELEQALREPL